MHFGQNDEEEGYFQSFSDRLNLIQAEAFKMVLGDFTSGKPQNLFHSIIGKE